VDGRRTVLKVAPEAAGTTEVECPLLALGHLAATDLADLVYATVEPSMACGPVWAYGSVVG